MNKLVEMRTDRGLTQEQVGEAVDVHHSRICRYEQGKASPSFSTFRALRELYGVTGTALLAAFEEALGLKSRSNGRKS